MILSFVSLLWNSVDIIPVTAIEFCEDIVLSNSKLYVVQRIIPVRFFNIYIYQPLRSGRIWYKVNFLNRV